MFCQPTSNPFMAVGAVVVEDQVQGHGARKLLIKAAQKLQELLMAMARVTLSDDAPFDDLERGEQSDGAAPLVVMGEGAVPSWFERQAWPEMGRSREVTGHLFSLANRKKRGS